MSRFILSLTERVLKSAPTFCGLIFVLASQSYDADWLFGEVGGFVGNDRQSGIATSSNATGKRRKRYQMPGRSGLRLRRASQKRFLYGKLMAVIVGQGMPLFCNENKKTSWSDHRICCKIGIPRQQLPTPVSPDRCHREWARENINQESESADASL